MHHNIKVKDLPKNERPQEKLVRYGVEKLSNAELLALVLRTGTREENVLNLSNRILCSNKGINGILELSFEDLMKIKGIGFAKASQIIYVDELFTRFRSFK